MDRIDRGCLPVNKVNGVNQAASGTTHGCPSFGGPACRRMAAEYVSAIGAEHARVADTCAQLRSDYLTIAGNLSRASSKTMDSDEKIALLREAKDLEAHAIRTVEKVIDALRAGEVPDTPSL